MDEVGFGGIAVKMRTQKILPAFMCCQEESEFDTADRLNEGEKGHMAAVKSCDLHVMRDCRK